MSEGIDAPEGPNKRLNKLVATTVVILSVAMAIGKIKDDNIVQAMQAAQASKIDLWNEYQATRIKQHDQQISAVLLDRMDGKAAAQARGNGQRYGQEALQLKQQAIAAQQDYDVEGRRDDQFDLSDGFLSIAVALAAISTLVESFGLLAIAWGSGAMGLLFSVAGFAQLPLHPNALVNFLS